MGDPPDYPTFATVIPDRRVAALRVDDVKGTHFYVVHSSSMEVVQSCATAVSYPKQRAKELDAQGDHAGALRTLLPPLANCKADRETLALVIEYACKASDAEVARKYWHLIPPELQRTLEPVCAQNGITRETLDRP